MKTCNACRRAKPEDEFDWKVTGVKRHGKCRVCTREYQKGWYHKNRDTHKKQSGESRTRRRAEARRLVRADKDKPCADCGNKYPYWVMDHDHRPGEVKLFDLNAACKTGVPVARIVAELAKCDVVCANCHRERTHTRHCQRV